MTKAKSNKVRLDTLLVTRGLFPSREAARRAVMAGLVRVDGTRADKPGARVAADAGIEVTGQAHPYVSRGGLKLEKALQVFPVSLAGRVVVDVGASTGGFTDCALRHGAALVYAVDVGYGQLAWTLRNHPRVVVMERTNFRHVDPARFHPRPDAAVMDVSFISVRLLFPKLAEVLLPPKDVIVLVKPQFEAGRAHVGKGGIVRNPDVHLQVLAQTIAAGTNHRLRCHGVDFSPITGGDGNVEFLAWFREGDGPPAVSDERLREVVAEAWAKARAGETVQKT
ncbi:putative rRNA methyltransferase YqxC [Alicyclobacillus cellulosilyticus]|uniref:rRNA methyltransferase YqxC n=1 Tax=Alicyclobacillus cellulosilyticus TaxID=1003997 RepID=A0A917K342_9BACL|nr:TlyA family RNA methyltransferase [Alicyclobacillus cellulosilyticus]GGI95832.1 putative rRNA methyltransferase YqxC [Alicyclobacillus cellulosilyticus]